MNLDTRTERLVLELRKKILNGNFRPGEHLTELGLVPALDASRTPIRIALERLSNEGLVEPIPSGGFRVRSFSLSDILDAIEIRGVLEGTAARFAAERLESSWELADLKQLGAETVLDIPITLEGFARYLEKNKSFHREVWRLAKSQSLFRELEHICRVPFAAPEALVFGSADPRAEPSVFVAAEQHRAMIEAIEDHEGTRAEGLAREHSRISRRNLQFAFCSEELSTSMPGAALITDY